ncbi:MAG: RluA family pseudouridine synthase [Pseudohongiellaceae bacterium]
MSSEQHGVQYLDTDERSVGQRLDNFLLTRLKGVPRSRIYRLIRKGEIRVNRKRCKPDQRLQGGDTVRVAPLRQRTPAKVPGISPRLRALLEDSILEENERFLVINKPAGLAVHLGSGVDIGLIEALRQLYAEDRALELVHRLDRDTSGCLLVARDSGMLKCLQDLWRKRRVNKTYQALVAGHWPDDCAEVDAPLQRDQLQAGERIVRIDRDGKPALTRFRVLERLRSATLIEASPVSGRTHQIRVHAQYAGHPILGDSKYLFRDSDPHPRINRLCLHAARLSFVLADGDGADRQYQFQAPLPERFQELLAELRETENPKIILSPRSRRRACHD